MTSNRRRKFLVSVGLSLTILSAQALGIECLSARAATDAPGQPDAAQMPLALRKPTAIAAATVPSSAPSAAVLTAGSREAANLLGVLPQVERLMEIRTARGGQASSTLTDEELALKVDVFDKVLGASLEIRMISGRIDRELAWSYAGLDMLTGKKQKLINNIVTANFMQIGVLGVLSGPMFLHGKPKVGTELLLIASCLGLTLSTAAFLVNKSNGSKRVDGGTNVLADVFHLEQSDPNHKAVVVAGYMNAVPPGSTSNTSRIQTLIDGWKRNKYLRSTNETALQKLAAIEPAGKKYNENIKILNNRIRMLFDTQYTIETLDSQLLDLLRLTDLG